MAEKTVGDLIATELIPFTKGTLMTTPIDDDFESEDAAVMYRLIDFVEKLCAARKEELKPTLHQYAETAGTTTEKGGFVATTGLGFKVTREKRTSSSPSAEGLKALLKEAGIDISEAFTTVKVMQLDPSKLKYLVESGKLPEDDVKQLYGISWALKVVEGKETKPLLKKAK